MGRILSTKSLRSEAYLRGDTFGEIPQKVRLAVDGIQLTLR